MLPERHVDTFRDVGEFPAEEAKRMLEFVAETRKDAGLDEYRLVVNVGEGAGQTIFHLHWHVLGGRRAGGRPDEPDRQARERAQGGDGRAGR